MFYKARNNTLYQDVVNQICQIILDGQIKKGELLPSEKNLCDQFGVSRTTVREALSILSQMKVIKTIRGKGSIVISDDFAYLNEGFRSKIMKFKSDFNCAVQARQLLEPQIAALAAQTATKRDIEDLQEINDRCERKRKEGTVTTEDLRMFHIRMAEVSQNPVLISFIETLIAMCDAGPETRMQVPNPSVKAAGTINATHEQILKAVRERNSQDAYFYMRENLKDFYINGLNESET